MGVGEREVQEGENICTHTTNSLCCTAETSTTLKSKHTPIKKKICELSSVSCLSMRCGFDPWVQQIGCRRARQSTPVFLLVEFHEQRSLAGDSP